MWHLTPRHGGDIDATVLVAVTVLMAAMDPMEAMGPMEATGPMAATVAMDIKWSTTTLAAVQAEATGATDPMGARVA